MNKMMEKLLILVLVAATYTDASKMCAGDEDCADLGDVFCMKSRCNWGLCGCPRGQAMRFLGSEKKFQCVPIRRVGESCSTDGDKGVCGAEFSECIDGKCICDHREDVTGITRRWSYWGGELCATQSQSGSGETCSVIDSLGICELSGSDLDFDKCNKNTDWWDGPLRSLPNTCGCDIGYRVALVNDFEIHAFTGNFIPRCVPIKFGELCLQDKDCQGVIGAGVTRMHCVDNKCACFTATYVPDFDGIRCGAGINLNVECFTGGTPGVFVPNSVCKGQDGLVCGDVCDVPNYEDTSKDKTCKCDASWTATTSGCTKVAEDASCEFDYQCKSLSRTAVCVEELCKAGAAGVYVSLVLMLGLLLINRVFYS